MQLHFPVHRPVGGEPDQFIVYEQAVEADAVGQFLLECVQVVHPPEHIFDLLRRNDCGIVRPPNDASQLRDSRQMFTIGRNNLNAQRRIHAQRIEPRPSSPQFWKQAMDGSPRFGKIGGWDFNWSTAEAISTTGRVVGASKVHATLLCEPSPWLREREPRAQGYITTISFNEWAGLWYASACFGRGGFPGSMGEG